MQIDNDLILKLEKLSNLSLSPEKREKIKGDLNNIIKLIDKMNDLDTDGIEPLIHVNEEPYELRADEVKNELPVDKALENAPKKVDNYFAVPKFVNL